VACPDPALGPSLQDQSGQEEALALSQHDDHQERMVGLVEAEVGLEAVEPFDHLEPARELDQGP
jgi:hypothetical protein